MPPVRQAYNSGVHLPGGPVLAHAFLPSPKPNRQWRQHLARLPDWLPQPTPKGVFFLSFSILPTHQAAYALPQPRLHTTLTLLGLAGPVLHPFSWPHAFAISCVSTLSLLRFVVFFVNVQHNVHEV